MNDLHELFLGLPLALIPTSNTPAVYAMLQLFADGRLHARDELNRLFGETYRSHLQQLRGDRYGYWLIHSLKQEGSRTTSLQLDPRHLASDPEQDAVARLERRSQLKRDSFTEAQQGWKRLPKAHKAMQEADKDYLKSLGEAANDEAGSK
ncbi:hypothetical protein J9B83_15210 [Marinomonas sp. A79]|uniref:Uncharacterized protein n=1 Tax=Marinomonas vulgaris TaxID=2823372 RepID=A0ABS5HGZ0_9GAMM|nr:hypothetical protein [Marinomonas vulgaris]MBR7890249.1 hypothetical protein [Marinomonas vulgaris]